MASNSVEFLYIAIVLTAVNVVPQIAISTIPRLQVAFSVSCMLPYALNPIIYHVSDMYWITVATLWILAGFLLYGHIFSKTLKKTFQVTIENEMLSEQLKHEKALVERASAAKTRFLAAASHDLRQPLQAQHFFVEALELTQDPTKQRKLIQNLKESSAILGKLLNSLLDISRLDANIVTTHIKPLPLEKLLNRLKASFKQQDKPIRIKFIPCPYWIQSDEVLLENVLRNLISNAVRYTEKGHVLIACSQAKNQQFTLEIRDSGIGIPADKMSFIFDEFY